MNIQGHQKLTLLDYPEKTASTVFLGGCNFRCPFCHNGDIVFPSSAGINEDEFFAYLKLRSGMIEGVCVSGGEPTLHPELPEFLRKIKSHGYLVKLDTNGYRPDVLASLVSEGLVDYVAMDIKNSKESYAHTVGIEDFDLSPIEKSAEFLMSGRVGFEFRTTVVRELHTETDIISIGKWLAGNEKFFLQPFKASDKMLSNMPMSSYSEAEFSRLLEIFKALVPYAQIRG